MSKKLEFLNNKYLRWYTAIIANCKRRISIGGYVETHHIIPRSLGGDNSKDNLVKLTPKEHFICHLLLTKFTLGNHKIKMVFAFRAMSLHGNGQERYRINSRFFQSIKKKVIFSQETKDKMAIAHTGLTQSKETIEKRVSKIRGRPSPIKGESIHDAVSKEKISVSMKISLSKLAKDEMSKRVTESFCNPKVYTEERARKISQGRLGKRYFNNGIIQIFVVVPPEGYKLGKLRSNYE